MGGRTEVGALPIHEGVLAPTRVSDELDAIIACSDPHRGESLLLGVALAECLARAPTFVRRAAFGRRHPPTFAQPRWRSRGASRF